MLLCVVYAGHAAVSQKASSLACAYFGQLHQDLAGG